MTSLSNHWDRPTQNRSAEEQEELGRLFGDSIDSRELIKPELGELMKKELWEYLVQKINKIHRENGGNTAEDRDYLTEQKIPKYMAYDIFNKFLTPVKDMKFTKPNEENKWLYDFLKDRLPSYYTRGITEQHEHYSAMFASEVLYALLEFQEQNGGGQGSSEKSAMEKALQNGNNGQLDKQIQKAMEKATEKAEQIEQMKNELGDEKGQDEEGGDNAGFDNNDTATINEGEQLEEYYEQLKYVNFSDKHMGNFIKDTIKMSSSYFSSKFTEKHESWLDAEEIQEMDGLENLLPALRNIHLDDIRTRSRQYHQKYDVYVDISGSMAGSKLTKAKVCALKMYKLGLVRHFYTFNSNVQKRKNRLHLLQTSCSGGTSTNRVIDQVKNKTQVPSVVITDCCDYVSIYDEKVYIVGIEGASFYGFDDLYKRNKQLSRITKDGHLEIVQ